MIKIYFIWIIFSLLLQHSFSLDVCPATIDVNLAPDDLNQIKSRSLLCTTDYNCYLTWEQGFIRDNVDIEVSIYRSFFIHQTVMYTLRLRRLCARCFPWNSPLKRNRMKFSFNKHESASLLALRELFFTSYLYSSLQSSVLGKVTTLLQ